MNVSTVIEGGPQIVKFNGTICSTNSKDIVRVRVQFWTCYFLSFLPIFFRFCIFYNKRMWKIFEIPANCRMLISWKYVLLILSDLNFINVSLMFDWKNDLRLRSKFWLFFQCRKYQFRVLVFVIKVKLRRLKKRVWFFECFPEFNDVSVGSYEFIVICLRTKPFDLSDGLTHMKTFQTVELRNMGLELSVVLERLLIIELIFLLFEEYDSSCIITNSKKVSWWVKLDLIDNVLFLYMLNWLLGSKYLFLWEIEMFWDF